MTKNIKDKNKYVGDYRRHIRGLNTMVPYQVRANNNKEAVKKIASMAFEQYRQTGIYSGVFCKLNKYTKNAIFIYEVDEWGHTKLIDKIDTSVSTSEQTKNGLREVGDGVYTNSDNTEVYL